MAEFAKKARRLAGMLAAVPLIGAVQGEVQRQEAVASLEKVIGWASVNGGTTGGLKAHPVTAKDGKSLVKLAENDEPAFHHNFFDGSKTRHPRVRFSGLVHVFNNYYLKNDYAVASTMDAAVLFEGNYLEDVSHPTHTQYGESDPGRLVERHNLYVRSGKPNARGVVHGPDAYSYSLDSAVNIPGMVGRDAGVGKVADR